MDSLGTTVLVCFFQQLCMSSNMVVDANMSIEECAHVGPLSIWSLKLGSLSMTSWETTPRWSLPSSSTLLTDTYKSTATTNIVANYEPLECTPLRAFVYHPSLLVEL